MPDMPITQPWTIGNDCILKYTLGASGIGTTELKCQNLSFSDSMETTEVTRRGDGWKMQVPVIRTLSMTLDIQYDPTDAVYGDLQACYASRGRVSFTIEDDRGNNLVSFCGFISKFDVNQSLGEAMKASLEILPAPGNNG